MIDADFVADASTILRDWLTGRGYTVAASAQPEQVRIQYFNLKKRLIAPGPRTVLVADGFSCPEAHRDGLAELRAKIEGGEDLRPHLSTGISNLDYDDALLNDWGIYHLHLGTAVRPDGFVTRTGPVLFARFDSSTAWFIAVLTHGQWSNQELVRAVQENWPESVERYQLKGVVGLEREVTDDDVRQARNAGIQTITQVPGGPAFGPMGGGYATDGTSIEVVMNSDALARQVRACELGIRGREDELRAAALRDGVTLPDLLLLRLERDGTGSLWCTHAGTGWRFRVADMPL